MIKLTANGKRIDTAQIERLFTQGEGFSDKICIQIDSVNNDVDVSGCTFIMRTAASDGSMTETLLAKELQEEVIILTWDVADTVTAVPGLLRLELVGTEDASVIIKYRMPPIFIKEAVMGTNIPVPDVVEEKLALMNELLDNVPVAINQEVIDARTGCFSNYTYSSLQQRLNAELGSCVRQNAFEQTVSALSIKDTDLEKEIAAARYGYVDTAGETRILYSTIDERIMADFISLWNAHQSLDQEVGAAHEGYFSGELQSSLAGRLNSDFAAVSGMFSSVRKDIAENAEAIAAVSARTDYVAGTTRKNLLKNTGTTRTVSGVTFTVNSDGSITVNGTATATAFFEMALETSLPASDLILSGCPAGGHAVDSYSLRLDNTSGIMVTDTGAGVTLPASISPETATKAVIRIGSGYTADNLVFYPMIRYADITDSTYETYVPSLQEQINELKNQLAALTANS